MVVFGSSDMYILSIYIIAILIHVKGQDYPQADTENGPVVGVYESSYSGFTYSAFKGIPFAEPPVGPNRFQEPKRLLTKRTKTFMAKNFGSPCVQLNQLNRTKLNGRVFYASIGEEDCLFLNIFTQVAGPSKKHVLFAIHGGGFTFGSGNDYGPQYVMDRPDIVFVTINYRLGPFGFLSTGDHVVPGNNGLKDQVAALQWVHRNIHNFGGDPTKVTLMGLSAGGASVDYMYLTPLTDGLFQRGYSFSGSSLNPWALVMDGKQKTRRLAKMLGCRKKKSLDMVRCLRRVPAKQINNKMRTFQPWLYNPFTIFGPVVEVNSTRPYIDKHPRTILRKGLGKDLPLIVGVTSEDGLYPAADFITKKPLMQILNNNWNKLGLTLLFPKPSKPRRLMKLAHDVRTHYLGDGKISVRNRKGLIRMLTERLFKRGIAEGALLRSKSNKSPVYLYLYGFQGATSVSDIFSETTMPLGCCHGDDFIQVVDVHPAVSHTTDTDRIMAGVFKNILYSYTVNGTLPNELFWKPVNAENINEVNYLDIKSPCSINMSREPMGDFDFLKKLFKD